MVYDQNEEEEFWEKGEEKLAKCNAFTWRDGGRERERERKFEKF